MATWEPVDIDYDKIGDEDYKWDDDVIKNLEVRFNPIRPGGGSEARMAKLTAANQKLLSYDAQTW